MKQVNIHEAKTHFSKLIEAVERGEEVVIARRGKPVARITACAEPIRRRRLGFAIGMIHEVDPEWDKPLTDEEIREWFGDEFADDIGS